MKLLKYAVALFIAILATGSIASTFSSDMTKQKSIFDIASKVYVDGKLVLSSRIITPANEKASFYTSNKEDPESLRVELIASDAPKNAGKDAIKINFDIQYKNNSHTKPRIVVLPKQAAAISITDDSGRVIKIETLALREKATY